MMLYKLINAMDKTSFQSCVVSLSDKGPIGEKIEKAGVQVYYLRMRGLNSIPGALWKLIHIINNEKPNIIQGWMYHGNIAAYIASILSKYKKIVIWNIRHSLHPNGREKYLTWLAIHIGARLSGKIPAIIYNSNVSLKQHMAIGYKTAHAEVIENGFDCEKFKPDEEARKKLRDSLGITPTEILVGHAARDHPMKDHMTLLCAAGIIVKKIKNVRFILAGRNIDTQNQCLKKLLKTKDLEGKVLMVGEYKKMHDFMAALDFFCLSSAWGEAFPNVLGEAMSCGVPCVATDVGDSGLIVGETGIIVAPQNPDQLVDAMETLIKLSIENRRRMGLRTRQRMLENFSIKKIAGKYEKKYYSLLTP